MRQNQLVIFPDQDQKFMYHKSEVGHEQNFSRNSFPAAEPSSEIDFSLKKNALRQAFPEIYAGSAFFDHASAHLEKWDHFHALAIRLDAPKEKGGDEPETSLSEMDALAFLAEILDQTCSRRSGFWGIIASDCLGCFLRAEDASDVLRTAEKVREDVKKSGLATVSIGISTYPLLLYKREETIENACKALDHASFFGPDAMVEFDAVSLNISGDKFYQRGDLDRAVKEFQTALLMDPDNFNVRNSLGVCYAVRGEHEKALEEFRIAMELDSSDVMAPYNTGLTHLMIKDEDKALQYFEKAYDLDDSQFEVALQLGRLFLKKDDPDTAHRYLENVIESVKESGPAYRLLGECRQKLRMADKAILAYTEAVRINGNDAYSLSALGRLYAEQGQDMEIALVFCRQSVELAPENGLFHCRLGMVYSRLGRHEEAIEEFNRAADLGHECQSLILQSQERMAANAS